VLSIDCRIVNGLGQATKTLALQLPLIAPVFPEIASCFEGSINVIMDAQLEVVSPDFVTQPIKWIPQSEITEVFGFVRVQFEVPNARVLTGAWIYIPYGSPHRSNPYYAEVIAPKPKLDLKGQSDCRIHFPATRTKARVYVPC
jgi:hypothetical protein